MSSDTPGSQWAGSAARRLIAYLGGAGAFAGLVTGGAMVVLALVGPMIAPFEPDAIASGQELVPPNSTHWFGTDNNGMDIFSRVISAPRYDVTIGVLATFVAVLVGLSLGLVAGFFGGVANLLVRISDVFQAFPVFILAMATVAFLGSSPRNLVIVVGLINAPLFARIAYSQSSRLRNMGFVDAARIAGRSDASILLSHVAPNSMSPVIAQSSITVGWTILLTAGLSFVGAGLRPPTPEWGSMIAIGASNMITGQWWPALFPGLALGLAVFGFAAIGDVLNRRLGQTAV